MKLPDDKRGRLKDPKGKLFESSEDALEYLDSISYDLIIAVGDVVSVDLIDSGSEPDIVIVDFSVMRSPLEKEKEEIIESYDIRKVEVDNPAGLITKELWESIRNAEPPLKIVVDGEEDLATIPAVLHAPLGSVVAYGQPSKGIVVIEVTDEKREEFRELLGLFEGEGESFEV